MPAYRDQQVKHSSLVVQDRNCEVAVDTMQACSGEREASLEGARLAKRGAWAAAPCVKAEERGGRKGWQIAA
jgi:hypothetical protein